MVRRIAAAVGLLVLLALWGGPAGAGPTEGGEVVPLAVYPFTAEAPEGEGGELARFASALTESVAIGIGRVEGVRSLDRSRVKRLFEEGVLALLEAGGTGPVQELRKLDTASHMVTGTVTGFGERAVRVRVVEVRSGRILGSRRIAVGSEPLSRVAERVTEAVASLVHPSGRERASEPGRKVAVGPILPLASSTAPVARGRALRGALSAGLAGKADLAVLARQKGYALFFERHLHELQYSTPDRDLPHNPAEVLVRGRYQDLGGRHRLLLFVDGFAPPAYETITVTAESYRDLAPRALRAIYRQLRPIGEGLSTGQRQRVRDLLAEAIKGADLACDKAGVHALEWSDSWKCPDSPPAADHVGALRPYDEWKKQSHPGLEEAIRRLRRALELDPDNLQAGMALAYVIRGKDEARANALWRDVVFRHPGSDAADYAGKQLRDKEVAWHAFQGLERPAREVFERLTATAFFEEERDGYGSRAWQAFSLEPERYHFLDENGYTDSRELSAGTHRLYALRQAGFSWAAAWRIYRTVRQSDYAVQEEEVLAASGRGLLGLEVERHGWKDDRVGKLKLPFFRFCGNGAPEPCSQRPEAKAVAISALANAAVLRPGSQRPRLFLARALEGSDHPYAGHALWIYNEVSRRAPGPIDRFLAAKAIDAVPDRSFPSMFEKVLMAQEYYPKATQRQLQAALDAAGEEIAPEELEGYLAAHRRFLTAQCRSLSTGFHGWEEQLEVIDAFYERAAEHPVLEGELTGILRAMASDCPRKYPYFALAARRSDPGVAKVQDAVLEKGANGELGPWDPEEFLEFVGPKAFRAVTSGAPEAEAYIRFLAGFKPGRQRHVSVIARIIALSGQEKRAERFLREYRRGGLEVRKASGRQDLIGVYVLSGLDDRGFPRYRKPDDPDLTVAFRPRAADRWAASGHWVISRKGEPQLESRVGDVDGRVSEEAYNTSHGGRGREFAFDWTEPPEEGGADKEADTASGERTWEVKQAEVVDGLSKERRRQSYPSAPDLMLANAHMARGVSLQGERAAVGASFMEVRRPIRNEDLTKRLDADPERIKDQLVESGLLDVYGRVNDQYEDRDWRLEEYKSLWPDKSVRSGIRQALEETLDAEAGGVYLYEHTGGQWVRGPLLTATDAAEGAKFGRDVALGPELLAVCSNTGVYIFRKEAGQWREQDKILRGPCSDVAQGPGWVAATIKAQTPRDRTAVYAFPVEDGRVGARQKVQPQDYKPRTREFLSYGANVSLGDGWMVVGNPKEPVRRDNGELRLYVGSAYVFKATAEGWKTHSKLTAVPERHQSEFFGRNTAAKGESLLVATDGGEVYRYELRQGQWAVTRKYRPPEGAEYKGAAKQMVAGNAGIFYFIPEYDPDWVFRLAP